MIEDAQGVRVYLLEDVVGHGCQAVNHRWMEGCGDLVDAVVPGR